MLPLPVPGLVDLLPSSILVWILVGIALYWAVVVFADRLDLLPGFVGTQGPILTIHTTRGRAFLDWLARPRRFWRAWSNFGVGVALVVMGSMFVFLLIAAMAALSQPEPTGVEQPQNVLVIPGVNDFLPLSATPAIVFGLLVGLVVHEGGHGLLCRVEDIEIDSMGVALLAIVPMGAFVQPDEESSRRASRGAQTRMFAAGVTNNFAISILAFALLFGPVVGSIAVAPGAAVGDVAPSAPASEAGLEPNDRITAVEGTPVAGNENLSPLLREADAGSTVTLEIDGTEEITVNRSLVVTAAVEDGPTSLEAGDVITAVDGRPVATERAFYEAVGDDRYAAIAVDGDAETVPVGALVSVVADGPLATAGAPTDTDIVVTAMAGERVHSQEDLNRVLEDTAAGDRVPVEMVVADGRELEANVTLGDHPRRNIGFLGVVAVPGVSGVLVDDLGVQLYPAGSYLATLGGDGGDGFGPTDTFLGKVGIVLLLPIIGVLGPLPFNFAGFTGGVENFYVAQGPLSALGDGGVFLAANLLFWTAWINVQLGFFNCIPAFPLDGGHVLRTSTEAVLSRLPVDVTRGMVRAVTTTVGVTMVVSVLLLVFGPQLT